MGRVDACHHHAGEESSEPQTLAHFSHAHPLARSVVPPPPEGGAVCDGCGLLCAGVAYACAACEYVLHRACATAPRSMEHPGHPPHELVFNASPPRAGAVFSCDACGEEVTGFCFRCNLCNLDFHVPCAALPHQMKNPSHDHTLTLHFSVPYPSGRFYCNICNLEGTPGCWLYHCATCDFDAHIRCADPTTPAPAKCATDEKPVMMPAQQYPTAYEQQIKFHQQMEQQRNVTAYEQYKMQQQMQQEMQQETNAVLASKQMKQFKLRQEMQLRLQQQRMDAINSSISKLGEIK